MRVIEQKTNELVLYGDQGVLVVPNTPYFSLKYNVYAGNKISYVICSKPDMAVYENDEKEFTCNYNKMEITVTLDNEINELCEIIQSHQKNNDTVLFVNFFCRHFAEQNQEEILEIFFAPYSHRIKKEVPAYTIDGVFGIDRWGNAYVNNPAKKNFPWQKISMEVKGNVQEYKIISSFDGQDLIMDANLQRYVTKTFYLLNKEKKDDALFMVQLPKKVQRWVENGDLSASVKWDKIIEIKEEKIFVPKCFGFFPTPPAVVEQLIGYANLEEGMKILEPSAGQGHILEFLKSYDVTCGELYHENRAILEQKGYKLAFENFLEYDMKILYDRIIMNPPFVGLNNERHADIDHVVHALNFLKPGGKLVSIMFGSIIHSNSKKAKKFREFVDNNGYFVELPKESFKESGTLIGTVMVVIDKQEEEK